MSLDKAILHGKEKRKPYYRAKRIDPTCRNHGTCPWCMKNRLYKFRDKHPAERGEDDIYGIQEFDPNPYGQSVT